MTDDQTLDFVRRLVNSEFWKWILERLEARERNVFSDLTNPSTTSDGRAMLTGRLLEIKDLENFPMTALSHLEDRRRKSGETDEAFEERTTGFEAPNIIY